MTDIEHAQAAATRALVEAGDHLTGVQRRAAWLEVRAAKTDDLDARRRMALSPYAVDGRHDASEYLSTPAMEVVHRTATDPGRLTRSWADEQIGELGEEMYTELIGVVAISSVIDVFNRAMGRFDVEVGDAVGGQPARVRPDDVGDVGAWVSQSVGSTVANVSRTLSLVPTTNEVWRRLVDTHYSRGVSFFDMSWEYALTRPQTELVAARTTVLNECFY